MKQNKPIADFFSALAFLTTIPVKQRTEWEDRGKLAFFPLVGLLIGVLLVIVDALAGIFFSFTARGLIDVLFLIVITGGLHLDGLADSADGLFSHRDKNIILGIMKDSRIGVFGTVALIMAISAKWWGISFFIPAERWIALLFIPVFSRSAMLIVLVFMPYVRDDGIASAFTSEKGKWKELYFVLIPLILPFFFSWRRAFVFIIVTCLTMLIWSMICHRKIGGVTGDTVGALEEIVAAALFLTGCAI